MPSSASAERSLVQIPEQATKQVLLKFTPSELARIEASARAAGQRRGPWIKKWLAEVCKALERERTGEAVVEGG